MDKSIRKTIDLDTVLYKQAKIYGKIRGCGNFSEIIRDMIRFLTMSAIVHNDQKPVVLDKPGETRRHKINSKNNRIKIRR